MCLWRCTVVWNHLVCLLIDCVLPLTMKRIYLSPWRQRPCFSQHSDHSRARKDVHRYPSEWMNTSSRERGWFQLQALSPLLSSAVSTCYLLIPPSVEVRCESPPSWSIFLDDKTRTSLYIIFLEQPSHRLFVTRNLWAVDLSFLSMKTANKHQDCKASENTLFKWADFDSKKIHTWELWQYGLNSVLDKAH